ncbi:hypothetical protein COLO4_07261 [Corchorus olitorius]|uniref:Uncharacterized protein n=1 Tax=Corchorus olitorius TaxID=93759 RepID=A0A1R3KKB7_9ROSI|nr:hypothetical protein COLO4_07261 [Corchorus olitorius]
MMTLFIGPRVRGEEDKDGVGKDELEQGDVEAEGHSNLFPEVSEPMELSQQMAGC